MYIFYPIPVVLCLEIIATTTVLFFLAKAAKEGIGGALKWAGYILLFIGFIAIGYTLSGTIAKMVHPNHFSNETL